VPPQPSACKSRRSSDTCKVEKLRADKQCPFSSVISVALGVSTQLIISQQVSQVSRSSPAGSDSFIASDTVLAETIKTRFSRGLTVENRGVQLHRYGSCWPLLEPACQTLVSSVTRMAAVNAARHIDSGVPFEHVPELPALLSAENRR
jgi:hypothetical protein